MRPDTPATIRIRGTIYAGANFPVPGALIETWQPHPDGWFGFDCHAERSRRSGLYCLARSGVLDGEGTYEIVTLKPGRSSAIHDVIQAPHLVVSIKAPDASIAAA